ncbi:MAG: rod shape-determining protein MreC [Prevotellaceae bacterium]|jgi:rod shape-determining protein MreC|nr:rod shape-determining protein MreC [Prevotellaceae bacterium]
MDNLFRFLIGIRVLLSFVILEVIALLLFTASSYYQQSVVVSKLHSIRGSLHEQVTHFAQYLDLRETNAMLAAENTALHNELACYRFVHSTSPGTVTNHAGAPLFNYIPANITDNSVNKQHNYIMLDAGAADHVAPDMGVVTQNGVIGIVMAVTEHYAIVKSLLHTDWRCNVRLVHAGDFGPLQWDGLTYNEAVLHDIPQHSNVQTGDTVVTSGYSSIFPPDIPVGVVKSYEIKRGNFYEIRIRLFADFKKIRHVNIVSFLYRHEVNTLNELRDEY